MRRFTAFFLVAVCFGAVFGRDLAQPTLPTVLLTIRDKQVTAEVADEDHERAAGMMHRTEVGRDAGMLFVMPRIDRAGFWMKNTVIPLSIAFISREGVILEVCEMEPLDETPVTSRFGNVAYALEMEKGWFAANAILPGDRVNGLPTHPVDPR